MYLKFYKWKVGIFSKIKYQQNNSFYDKTVSTHNATHLEAVSTINSLFFLVLWPSSLCSWKSSPPDLRASREVTDTTKPLCYRHHWDAVAKWTAATSKNVQRKCQVIISHFSVFIKISVRTMFGVPLYHRLIKANATKGSDMKW